MLFDKENGLREDLLLLDDQAVLILGKGLPLIRQKLPETIDRVTHDTTEQVIQVLPGIDPASFAGLDESQEQGRGPRPSFTGRKQPVLPAQGQGTYGVLGDVVVRLQTSIFQIAIEGLPLIEGIIHGFPQRLRRNRLGFKLFDPG